jgi:photosystem II stability/assembly factor-like uncharacterized protein
MPPLRWFFVSCFATLLGAQGVSPDLFSGLRWRLIGPFRGGRGVAVSGVPGNGRLFYSGYVNGGVWKTTDAGTTWTSIFEGQPDASIGALAVAPSSPNVLYAGTGESDIRSDLATGNGVYKSMDGGETWQNIGLKETRQISRIVVDPVHPEVVYVAALGHAYGPNDERGVYKSTDGGSTWAHILNKGSRIGSADLAIAVDAPNILVAAMWEAHRPPWSTYAPIGGPGSGLHRSTDGGETWTQLTGNGLPGGEWGRVGVAIAPNTHGKRIYALIEAKEAGLYRSDDGGDTWTRANSDPRITSRAWYFASVTVDPNDPDTVYIPNVALYEASQRGKTLSIVRGAPGGDDYHQLWIDPADSSRMVLGTDQGTSVTLNRGVTWSSWYNQPTGQFYHVITDNQFPYNVYGSQQDTAGIPSRTDHGHIDGRDWFSVGGSESGYIAPDPLDPNIIYSSGIYGTVSRFDRRTSQGQEISPWPMPGFSQEISQRTYRDPWTPVLVFSQTQPGTLFLGTQYVMKTLDGGLHWQTISPDLTGDIRKSAQEKFDGPVTVDNARERGFGVVYTVAPSPLSAVEVWAGSDSGLIHVTRNSGKSWTNVTPPGLSPWSKITRIEVSHFNPGEAYAAVDRHRLDDLRPYLFRTKDFGKTWKPIVTGIGDRDFLNAIQEDPKTQGLLFAATEFGVYVSFDDGDHWQSLQLNLPVTSVRDLVIHENDLVVATHGRSFWILDDISPLRQIGTVKTSSKQINTRLFKPAQVLRITSDNFLGTPLPPEEPQAENPPRGAYLDYYLSEPSGEVVLEILDSQNRLVRRFSSKDRPSRPHASAAIAPRWFPGPQVLSTAPGMHRFVWDLRYGRSGVKADDDDSDEDSDRWQGPLVMPGAYHAKLIAGGSEFVQPVQVSMDPRSRATREQLAAQFDLAQRAFENMIQGMKAVGEINALHARLSAIQGAAGSPEALRSSATALDKEASSVLAGPPQSPDQGLRFTTLGLTVALSVVEGADRTPPSQVQELYGQSVRTLKLKLADWQALKAGALANLNQQLRQAGLAEIEIAELEEEAEDSLAK